MFEYSHAPVEYTDPVVPWYRVHGAGSGVVTKSNWYIANYAVKYNVDVNLIKAIVYVENSRGLYDSLEPAPSTIRPMNIIPDLWGELLPGRNISGNTAANIEVASSSYPKS